MTVRATLLACLLALLGAAQADAKTASFDVSLNGTQTSVVDSSDSCRDASGADTTLTGRLTERTDFHTTRTGRIRFVTGRHGAVSLEQSRAMLAAGTVARDSSLDQRGTNPGGCADVVAASGCASLPFDAWRLSLSGGLVITLGAGPVAGGDPFRTCQNPFDGFPHLVRRASARATSKLLFNRKKRTVKLAGRLDGTRAFADGYSGAKGTAATSLRYTAVLTRR